jgi:hypothetical protein
MLAQSLNDIGHAITTADPDVSGSDRLFKPDGTEHLCYLVSYPRMA